MKTHPGDAATFRGEAADGKIWPCVISMEIICQELSRKRTEKLGYMSEENIKKNKEKSEENQQQCKVCWLQESIFIWGLITILSRTTSVYEK